MDASLGIGLLSTLVSILTAHRIAQSRKGTGIDGIMISLMGSFGMFLTSYILLHEIGNVIASYAGGERFFEEISFVMFGILFALISIIGSIKVSIEAIYSENKVIKKRKTIWWNQ